MPEAAQAPPASTDRRRLSEVLRELRVGDGERVSVADLGARSLRRILLSRVASDPSDFYGLPRGRVVELGSQIVI